MARLERRSDNPQSPGARPATAKPAVAGNYDAASRRTYPPEAPRRYGVLYGVYTMRLEQAIPIMPQLQSAYPGPILYTKAYSKEGSTSPEPMPQNRREEIANRWR